MKQLGGEMNATGILSELHNELQSKKTNKKKEKKKASALSNVCSQLLRWRDETRQEAFSLPLQKRKQLAPDTQAAWRPKSPARFGFPFGAYRHNVKDRWGILMKNQCPESQLSALQMQCYWNKSRQCVCERLCVHYNSTNALFSVAFWCRWKLFVIDGTVLHLTLSHLFKGTLALNHSWGTFSICVGGKEEAGEGVGLAEQFGVVRSGRHTKSSCTAVFVKLFWEHGLVHLSNNNNLKKQWKTKHKLEHCYTRK